MAVKKDNPLDFLPPQQLLGNTPEQRDAEVASRIKDCLCQLLDAMGAPPQIAEGKVTPDTDTMERSYKALGLLMQCLRQRLDSRQEVPHSKRPRTGQSRKTITVRAEVHGDSFE